MHAWADSFKCALAATRMLKKSASCSGSVQAQVKAENKNLIVAQP